MVGENLLRYDKEQVYNLYDYETCNLNLVHEKNLPWEYASWLVTKDKVLEKKYFLINWEKAGRKLEVSDDAARLTGFYTKYPKLMTEGLHPEEALERIEKDFDNSKIIPVAHNGFGFDVYMQNLMRKILGKKPDYSYIKRYIDTNLIARAWKLEVPFPADRKDLLSFQYKMSSHRVKGVKTSIKALCADFGIEYDETRAHDSSYDCGRLYEILKQLLWKVEI